MAQTPDSPAREARIRDWKGMLAQESRRTKTLLFAALLVVAASMTFTQFGFVGLGDHDETIAYMLGLLAPIAATALLLGKGAGTLMGLLSGGVLYAHARLQPLDLIERYFVNVFNSFVLYALAGYFLGLLFAVALRNDPAGVRRCLYQALVCFFVSVAVSVAFIVNSVVGLIFSIVPVIDKITNTTSVPQQWEAALDAIGSLDIQIVLDLALMLAVTLACERVLARRRQMAGHTSVRTTFRTQLFVVATLVFCVTQATSFVIITINAKASTSAHMQNELAYLQGQMDKAQAHHLHLEEISQAYALPQDVSQNLLTSANIADALDGYDLSDGTVVVFEDDRVVYSDNPAYPMDERVDDLLDTWSLGTLEELSQEDAARVMLYDTRRISGGDKAELFSTAQLGYMRVVRSGTRYLMMAMPASMVFANREATVRWVSLVAFVLLVTVFVLATLLLGRDVVSPIDRTNASLAKICAGNLDEVVSERGNVEFASLSAGINETVDALKGLIAEAERRNERDLATAKVIQESALPRTFPPFPEVGAFDIFAAMDAAREVGGDFYDFFLIDDHTLGFLIADVSGKGIPGALFMMAAKTEIENYLSTGMAPADAITSANRRLCANNDAGMFVTVWAATLDWQTGLLTYVNAGHNFPLLRRGGGGSWEWLCKKCGLFLGTFETAKYRQETLTLAPGDELLLYTDGVNEAFDPQEQEYGNDRLEAFVAAHATMHPRELVRSLRSDVAAWANGAEQSDDVTILALEYGVAPEVTGSITVPATLEHLGEATALVAGELERRLCPVSVQRKVEVALEELFVNVCNYAYAEADEPGPVQVSYAYGTDPSSITVELRDHGVAFDPVRREDPTKPSSAQEAKVGGLGIYMVKRTMDDLIYLRDDDQNVVVFRKCW